MRMLVLMCLVTAACAAPQYKYPSPPPPPPPPPPPTYGTPPPPPPPPPPPTYGTPPPKHTYGATKPVANIVTEDRKGPDASGAYTFNFESSDGIRREETGTPGAAGAVASHGGWWFTFPDGSSGHFTFVADGEGYKVESDRLPVGPPLPPHAIAQIEKAKKEDAAAAAAPQHQYGVPPPPPVYG